jgi:cytochrome c
MAKGPRMLRLLVVPVLLVAASGIPAQTQTPEPRVLVFSKTAGYRHSSIETGIAAVRRLGRENGFAVEATEDAGAFNEKNLRRFRAVVFLSTTTSSTCSEPVSRQGSSHNGRRRWDSPPLTTPH